MCGLVMVGEQRFEIYCEVLDPFWWKHPDPPFDFGRLVLGRPDDLRESWRGELTEISRILVSASQFEDRGIGDRLGAVAAELGNAISERAGVDVRWEWSGHEAA